MKKFWTFSNGIAISLSKALVWILFGFIFIASAEAARPLWRFTPNSNFPPNLTLTTLGSATVKYTITNNSLKMKNLVLKPTQGITQVGSCVIGPVGSLNSSCILTLIISGKDLSSQGLHEGPVLCQANSDHTPNFSICDQPQKKDRLAIKISSAAPLLKASTANLALSISGLTLEGLSSGQPRVITFTNTGDLQALGLSIKYPNWPRNTKVDSSSPSACTNGANLNAGSSCTITIVPGNTPTSGLGGSDCDTGLAVLPGVVSVSASNSNSASTNVVILNYACIYQGGYVFAMFETENKNQSIGGKVVAEEDQSNGIIWSSNGTAGKVSNDSIPGIGENSHPGNSVPTYSESEDLFNKSYMRTNQFVFPAEKTFSACTGLTDGACNSRNILNFYDSYTTNYGTSSALVSKPTDRSFYAAGLCTQKIKDYEDWYLPALCEMSSNNNTGCVLGSQSIFENLPQLIGDNSGLDPTTSCTLGINCIVGNYWSSTEFLLAPLSFPENSSWGQYFDVNFNNQLGSSKSQSNIVRCVRKLS